MRVSLTPTPTPNTTDSQPSTSLLLDDVCGCLPGGAQLTRILTLVLYTFCCTASIATSVALLWLGALEFETVTNHKNWVNPKNNNQPIEQMCANLHQRLTLACFGINIAPAIIMLVIIAYLLFRKRLVDRETPFGFSCFFFFILFTIWVWIGKTVMAAHDLQHLDFKCRENWQNADLSIYVSLFDYEVQFWYWSCVMMAVCLPYILFVMIVVTIACFKSE